MLQPMHWVSVVATIFSGAVVAAVLWWSYSRARSGGTKALIAAGMALLGFALFCLVQAGLEVAHPADKTNGDIIAYDTNIFLGFLVVIEVAVFLLRRKSNSS
jgi:hypothetical protein